jgi:hypothetical protein
MQAVLTIITFALVVILHVKLVKLLAQLVYLV